MNDRSPNYIVSTPHHSEPDELAKRWGAWGGDRKLSPRFRPLPEERSRRGGAIAWTLGSAAIGTLVLAWGLFGR